MRKKERQTVIQVKNLGNRGWHNNVITRERIVQVNLFNMNKKDGQVKLYIKKKTLQINLLSVDNTDWQTSQLHILVISEYLFCASTKAVSLIW